MHPQPRLAAGTGVIVCISEHRGAPPPPPLETFGDYSKKSEESQWSQHSHPDPARGCGWARWSCCCKTSQQQVQPCHVRQASQSLLQDGASVRHLELAIWITILLRSGWTCLVAMVSLSARQIWLMMPDFSLYSICVFVCFASLDSPKAWRIFCVAKSF